MSQLIPSDQDLAVRVNAPSKPQGAMKSEPRPQESDPPTQHLRNADDLNREMQQMWEMEEHLAIAQRAYELFESRCYEHGHDWEDWFRAESELHLNE